VFAALKKGHKKKTYFQALTLYHNPRDSSTGFWEIPDFYKPFMIMSQYTTYENVPDVVE
jgi:hypothetical protein